MCPMPIARKTSMLLALFVLLFLGACPSRAIGADAVTLSVEDAVRLAIERNLGLQVATYTPAIAETGIRKARAIYDPQFTSLLDYRGSNLKSAPLAALVTRSRSADLNASLSRLLPTGATAGLSFTNLWVEDNLGSPLSRFVEPQLTLSFSQPLLQGFGREVTERDITNASDAMDASFADWQQQALNTAADARDQYLALVVARESLDTRRASLDLALQVQAENEARVKAGVLAAYQLQDSTLGVLQARKNLLDAERAEKDAADQLRTTLHLMTGTAIVTTAVPPPAASEIPEAGALQTAMHRRPDVVKARVAVRTAEFNERVSGNLALPSLALQGSGGVAGLDTAYGKAFDEMSSGQYPIWSVGLSFSVPLGNNSALADLAAARLKASQARAQLSSTEESATLEVRTALRALASAKEQIGVTAQGVKAAEVLLDSYLKRQQLGLATTKDVLDVSASLTQARESSTAARADFQTAFTKLWKATGELLDREGIRLEGNFNAPGQRKGTP
jgi:outer membrane protein TolC